MVRVHAGDAFLHHLEACQEPRAAMALDEY